MRSMKPSDDERQTWRNLNESVRRNREATDDLNKWLKSKDRTPKPKPQPSGQGDDGCLITFLPLLIVLAAGAMQVLS